MYLSPLHSSHGRSSIILNSSILQIVSVVLENYKGQSKESNGADVQENEGYVSVPSSPDVGMKVPNWKTIINEKGQLNVTA